MNIGSVDEGEAYLEPLACFRSCVCCYNRSDVFSGSCCKLQLKQG